MFEVESADAEVLLQALAVLRARSDLKAGEVNDGALLAAMAREVVHDAERPEAPTGERYRVVIEHCPTCRRTVSPEAEVSDTIASEATCDAEIIEMRRGPEQGHMTRAIPPVMRRIVLHRAHWRCEVPHCSNRLWLDIHHVRPRSEGGRNVAENLGVVCCAHHRAVHDGALALYRTKDGALAVEHADGRRYVGSAHVGDSAGVRSARCAAGSRRCADP
jgi:5-methylcytosine-specific restriction endonuclease McrA